MVRMSFFRSLGIYQNFPTIAEMYSIIISIVIRIQGSDVDIITRSKYNADIR